jgi:hypothetical protein
MFNNVQKVSEDHWKNKIKIQKGEPADEDERKGGGRKASNRMETTSPIPTKFKPVQSRRVRCKLNLICTVGKLKERHKKH